MNLPGQTTLHSSGVKARQPPWSPGPVLEVGLGLGTRALPRQVARGPAAASDPGVAVRGVVERFLAVEGLLGSFSLLARAPDAAGRVMGSCAFVPRLRLAKEVVEVLHGPRHPQLVEGEAARGTAQGSPLRR